VQFCLRGRSDDCAIPRAPIVMEEFPAKGRVILPLFVYTFFFFPPPSPVVAGFSAGPLTSDSSFFFVGNWGHVVSHFFWGRWIFFLSPLTPASKTGPLERDAQPRFRGSPALLASPFGYPPEHVRFLFRSRRVRTRQFGGESVFFPTALLFLFLLMR